jgi:hypothetical protein
VFWGAQTVSLSVGDGGDVAFSRGRERGENVATPTQIRRGGRFGLLLGVLLALVAFSAVAYADDIANNLDPSVDAVAEVMPLVEGGDSGTTRLYVVPRNGDGKNGCNLTGGTTLTVSVASSNPAVATVSPNSITFTSCVGEPSGPTLTVTPHAQGSATVSVTQTANTTGATFALASAAFTVNVAPPPNTPPLIAVVGVTGGASYAKGSVPAAMCDVTDAEDGDSSFAATLSAVSGPYAADGIGAQTASCSYTDAGGLTASASETYGIVDPSPPSIGYAVSGTVGDNGWYVSDVGLTWSVGDAESPSSLTKSGCVDQSIVSDQPATSYSCSAASAGGSAGPVDVSIKRDASAPSVSGAPVDAPNADGWYSGDVAIAWACSDNGPSGLAVACPATTTIGGEGRGMTDSLGPIRDNAGNATIGISAPGVNIDRTAPHVEASTSASPIDVAGTDWYKDSVTFSWSASDPALADASAGSGVKVGPTPASVTFDTTGAHSSSAEATDEAGNTGVGHLSGVNVDASAPVLGVCPAGGPFLLNSGVHAVGPIAASDTGSGIDADASTLSGSIDTASVGNKTLTFSAHDNVGHVTSKTCDYVVSYVFSGLFAPIDRPNTMNVSKAGQSIPLKWRLTDALGAPVTDLGSVVVTVTGISCALGSTADLIEEVAAGSSGLQNLGDGYYQLNWKTPGSYAGSCKSLNLNLGEGATRTNLAYISFKK